MKFSVTLPFGSCFSLAAPPPPPPQAESKIAEAKSVTDIDFKALFGVLIFFIVDDLPFY
ncbi:hypothetical protein D1872_296450 [compost metagenome]